MTQMQFGAFYAFRKSRALQSMVRPTIAGRSSGMSHSYYHNRTIILNNLKNANALGVKAFPGLVKKKDHSRELSKDLEKIATYSVTPRAMSFSSASRTSF